MKKFSIKQKRTGKILFSGKFKNFKECLEEAVQRKINLSEAQLAYKNLSNINIDNAQLYGADFTNSNLSQANLSEGNFENANFNRANLVGACMSESNFKNANFKNTSFGANILNDAIMDHCIFNTLSAYTLDFYSLRSMLMCSFLHHDKFLFNLSKPPTVVLGKSSYPIIIVEKNAYFGHEEIDLTKIQTFIPFQKTILACIKNLTDMDK